MMRLTQFVEALKALDLEGWWMDAGENAESLLQANITVARSQGVDI